MKTYHITITETVLTTRTRTIRAANEDDARETAYGTWDDPTVGWQERPGATDIEIVECEDVTPPPVIQPDLRDLADRCYQLFEQTIKEDADLWGLSVLDLCADNLPARLPDLRRAIVLSNIYLIANERIRKQIENYTD